MPPYDLVSPVTVTAASAALTPGTSDGGPWSSDPGPPSAPWSYFDSFSMGSRLLAQSAMTPSTSGW